MTNRPTVEPSVTIPAGQLLAPVDEEDLIRMVQSPPLHVTVHVVIGRQ